LAQINAKNDKDNIEMHEFIALKKLAAELLMTRRSCGLLLQGRWWR
jgi:hypothetical protein